MTTQITTHGADALARLRERFRDKPKIAAFLNIFTTQIQEIEDMFWALCTERGIDTAVGDQLDLIGVLVGQPRAGLTDAVYRRYLRARIATNKSDGQTNELLHIMDLVLNDEDALFRLAMQFPASFQIEIQDVATTEAIAIIMADFLRDATSAGVRALLQWSVDVPAEMFTFAIFTPLNGLHGIGSTTLTVISTADFPSSGSLDLDLALAVAETVSYSGKTATTFTGVSATANAHADGSAVQLNGSPGKGWGDQGVPATGGYFAGVKEGS